MKIAATAYLMEGDDHNAVQLLLIGFTGTLKFWWENFLNDEEKFYVSTSINENGEQDVVLKLVYAIAKHFVGDPTIFAERNYEILQNLKCRTRSDFKWYHDVFLAKLFFRPYARASFWKEKFIFGIPKALNEKVQESLREKNNGTIPYADLTYGDLKSEVKKEGL